MPKQPIETQLETALREAIVASGKSYYALAHEAGIDHGRISRFARGEMGLTLNGAGLLAAVLGLELRGVRKRPAK